MLALQQPPPLRHPAAPGATAAARRRGGGAARAASGGPRRRPPGGGRAAAAGAAAGSDSLWRRAVGAAPPAWPPFLGALAAAGASLGTALDLIHSRVGLQVYDAAPLTLGPAPGLPTSAAVPALLAAFYAVLGALACGADNLAGGDGDAATAAARARAARGLAAWVAPCGAALAASLAASAALYERGAPPASIAAVLAALTAANWAAWDRTAQGAALMALCGVGAPAAELVLMAATHCWHYPAADLSVGGGPGIVAASPGVLEEIRPSSGAARARAAAVEMGDVHYIVDKLNAPPFSLGESLRHAGGHETAEQAAERLAAFLRTVKFAPGMDALTFRQLLAAADRDTVHGVLKWVLAQGAALEKTAFVGFHLSLPEVQRRRVAAPRAPALPAPAPAPRGFLPRGCPARRQMPEELGYHPEVLELKDAIRSLQGEFVATHKALDAAHGGVKELPALRARIKQMAEEKERLGERVEAAAAAAATLPDAGGFRNACVSLRQEHDREVAISQKLQAQQQAMERAEAAYARSAGRLREMQAALAAQGGGDGARVLEVLQDDVARLRAQVRQAHQMAALVGRKRAELAAKLERLQERRDALAAELDSSGARVGACGVSDAEWAAKYAEIKAQLPAFKALKQQLADLEAEAFVLQRTLEVLGQQEEELRGRTGGEEPRAGAPAAGAETDEAGGAELAADDSDAEAVAAAVAHRKAELAPAIQELRALRAQHQELEAVHDERKAAYGAALGGLEAAVSGLEGDVAALAAEADAAAAALAQARARVAELGGSVERLAAAGGEALRRRCQARLAEAEADLRRLREQQRGARDAAAHGQAQAAMLSDLAALLDLKAGLAAQQQHQQRALGGGAQQLGTASFNGNVMVL
ncbi:IFT81 [Scenedesmus sp. PABB004]|nr:IFT81 [Scenedesmus sp. PABB004]